MTKLCLTLCSPMDWSTPGFPVLNYLQEIVHSHVQLSWWCHPTVSSSVTLFSFCFQSFQLKGLIRVWSNELTLCIIWQSIRVFRFSIRPSNEHSGLISFKMIDWFDLLAVQGTHNSLLQHHSLKASILHHSAFFIIQLSHLYMTTGKWFWLYRLLLPN